MNNSKFYYTYVTTNNLNGYQYIGSHTADKLNNDYLGSGTALLQAIKQDGKDNFSKKILAIYNTREDAYIAESQLLNDKWFSDSTYNIRKTSVGIIEHTQEAKLKQSILKSGERNPMFGKPSPNVGKPKSPIFKNIVSQKLKGTSINDRQVQHKKSGVIFSTIKEAAQAYGIKYPNLKQQLLRNSINCEFEYLTTRNNKTDTSSQDVQQ